MIIHDGYITRKAKRFSRSTRHIKTKRGHKIRQTYLEKKLKNKNIFLLKYWNNKVTLSLPQIIFPESYAGKRVRIKIEEVNE